MELAPAGRPAGLTPRLLEVIRPALLELFREEPPSPPAKRIVLPGVASRANSARNHAGNRFVQIDGVGYA